MAQIKQNEETMDKHMKMVQEAMKEDQRLIDTDENYRKRSEKSKQILKRKVHRFGKDNWS